MTAALGDRRQRQRCGESAALEEQEEREVRTR